MDDQSILLMLVTQQCHEELKLNDLLGSAAKWHSLTDRYILLRLLAMCEQLMRCVRVCMCVLCVSMKKCAPREVNCSRNNHRTGFEYFFRRLYK